VVVLEGRLALTMYRSLALRSELESCTRMGVTISLMRGGALSQTVLAYDASGIQVFLRSIDSDKEWSRHPVV
jgi:hypothetical protein